MYLVAAAVIVVLVLGYFALAAWVAVSCEVFDMGTDAHGSEWELEPQ